MEQQSNKSPRTLQVHAPRARWQQRRFPLLVECSHWGGQTKTKGLDGAPAVDLQAATRAPAPGQALAKAPTPTRDPGLAVAAAGLAEAHPSAEAPRCLQHRVVDVSACWRQRHQEPRNRRDRTPPSRPSLERAGSETTAEAKAGAYCLHRTPALQCRTDKRGIVPSPRARLCCFRDPLEPCRTALIGGTESSPEPSNPAAGDGASDRAWVLGGTLPSIAFGKYSRLLQTTVTGQGTVTKRMEANPLLPSPEQPHLRHCGR